MKGRTRIKAEIPSLRVLVKTYEDIQTQRLEIQNRIRSAKLEETFRLEMKKLAALLHKKENRFRYNILKKLRDYPEWMLWMRYVKGVGPIVAGKLLAYIDFSKAKHPSSLSSYAGLGVEDGKAVRRTRGKKSAGNPAVKSTCYVLAESFEKQTGKRGGRRGGYRKLIDRYWKHELKKRRFIIPIANIDPSYHGGHIYDPMYSATGTEYLGQTLNKKDIETIKHELSANETLVLEDKGGARIRVPVPQLDPQIHTGMVYCGRPLTKNFAEHLKESHAKHEKILLERTLAHVRLRVFRKVVKIFLSHLYIVHAWIVEDRLEIYYSSRDHGWTYMPVLDIGPQQYLKDPKFIWWRTLKKAYEDVGIKPIII